MAFGKHIIVISGSGQTGLVKLSGSFDGLNKVKGECRADAAAGGGKLYVISGDVTEINVEGVKTTFEAPIFAKGDIYCLLVTGGKTLAGSSGGRADRRQLEARVEAFKRERLRAANAARQAEVLTREAAAARDEAHRHDALSPSPSDGVAAEDERPSHEHVVPTHVFRDAEAKAYARPSEAPFAPTGRRTAEASGRPIGVCCARKFRRIDDGEHPAPEAAGEASGAQEGGEETGRRRQPVARFLQYGL